MSVVTFAHPEVRKLIDERFVFVEINVDHEKDAADWFEVKGIPDTYILSSDGAVVDRVLGFEEPEKFAARLKKALAGREDGEGGAVRKGER